MMIEIEPIRRLYESLDPCHAAARKKLGRALTYAEKVLFSHLAEPGKFDLLRGKSEVGFRPDRVAMQDATAQMALLQFMLCGRATAAVPTTVHCDHLIRARTGAAADLKNALNENDEVYEFLRTCSQKYGIGFWRPGAGIIHQVVLENYACPGCMMIGTDSHTPNAGGLGMIAVGVGGADAVDVMAGQPWVLRWPKLIGFHLTGNLNGWTSAKDVILKVAEILTVKGGTNAVVEYFGPGAASISCTGKGTITNMGAEVGATTSIFPYDSRMATYLRATDRAALADLADRHAASLKADPEIEKSPEKFFDVVHEIDLSKLEPHVVGPHTPDLARPISRLAEDVRKNGWPADFKAALIGSCTNSSYEDLSRSAHIARQGVRHGLKARAPFLVTPGSEQIFQTVKRDGQMEAFERMGGAVLANACGPCIGQWDRSDVKSGEKNSIITSYNRNFKKRNDGNPETCAFIGSPELVTALAFAGTLTFNPLTDTLKAPDGTEVRFEPPAGDELPKNGFTCKDSGYEAPAGDAKKIQVHIRPDSQRLAFLEPFDALDLVKDFESLLILLKAQGKCTTDHISQAGPWLRFRGHLDKISDNMFLGAANAFTGDAGKGKNILTGETASFPDVARSYKKRGQGWVVVGDENYGEGSSREHAAMEPRYLGCRAVIVKSFARIHETNLKKQGVLPLTLQTPSDYDKFREADRVTLRGLPGIAPGSVVEILIRHEEGKTETVKAVHTLSPEQIDWFRAGSALSHFQNINLSRK